MELVKKALEITAASASLIALCLSTANAATAYSGGVSPSASVISVAPTLPGSPSGLTVCAQGKITKLERVWGSDSTVRLASESTPSQPVYYRDVPGLGLMTEMTFEAVASDRGKDRLALLQLALAQKLPVQIVSRDYSCIGSQDKFDITLCTDGNACAMPR